MNDDDDNAGDIDPNGYYKFCFISLCIRDALLLRSKSEDMVSVLHTNLLGSMLTCRAALRGMLSHGGAIVNLGDLLFVHTTIK